MRKNKRSNFDYLQTLSLQQLHEFKSKFLKFQEDKKTLEKIKSEKVAEFKKKTKDKICKIRILNEQYLLLDKFISSNKATMVDVILGKSISYNTIALDISEEIKICDDNYALPKYRTDGLMWLDDFRIGRHRPEKYSDVKNVKAVMYSALVDLGNIKSEMLAIKKSIAAEENDLIILIAKIEGEISSSMTFKINKNEKIFYFNNYREHQIQLQINKIERYEILKAKEAAYDNKQREHSTIIKIKIKDQIQIYPNCPYCNILLNMDDAHADHIYPIKKGGHSTSSNMVYVCSSCNLSKGDTTLRSYIMKKKLNEQSIYAILDILHKEF